ncbi:MAG TPA: hypothetical protein VGQ65_05610 [Thermoanaerobaculia bacterium]|jgi:hypothetical protein|nr:hypothetical protein [Thermoanaerobaculia bacterium]
MPQPQPTPQPVWQPYPDTIQGNTGLSFGNGAVYYASAETGGIQALDFHSGQPLPAWATNNQPGIAWRSPVFTSLGPKPGGLYASDLFGTVYGIDLYTGNVDWQSDVSPNAPFGISGPLVAPNYQIGTPAGPWAVYVADSSSLYCIQLIGAVPNVTTVYTSDTGIDPTAMPVYDPATGQFFLVEGAPASANAPSAGNILSAITPSAALPFVKRWSLVCDATPAQPLTQPVLFGNSLYLCDSESNLHIVSAQSGTGVTSPDSMQGTLATPVAVVTYKPPTGNAQLQVFATTTSGYLYCLDGMTGAILGQTQPMGSSVSGPLTAPVISNGIVYLGGSNQTIYGVPLDPNEPVVFLDLLTEIVGIAGVSNGNVYVGLDGSIIAVNLASVVKCFQIECDLIQDFADTPGTATQTANFHAHVSLFQPAQNGYLISAPTEVVQISASQDVTVTVNSTQTFAIGPNTTANLTADPNGKIVITMPANSTATTGTNASSGLCCPMLMLWSNFMSAEERVVIYPDQPLHDRLAAVKPGTLQNLASFGATATTAGTTILPTNFQGKEGWKNAHHLSSTINSAFGRTSDAFGDAVTTSRYLAARTMSPGVGVVASPPARSARRYTSQPFSFRMHKDGTTHFSNDPKEIAAHAAEIRALAGNTAEVALPGLPEWCDNIINGFITDVEIFLPGIVVLYDEAKQEITTLVHAIENGVSSFYNWALQTAEDVGNLVLGVLAAIASAIENVVNDIIQALSFLFNWGDIINTANAIANGITTVFTSLTTNAPRTAKRDVAKFFASIQTQIASSFTNAKIVNQTSSAVGSQNQDPSTAYNKGNGSSNSVGCTSFSQKTTNNMPSSSSSAPFFAAAIDGNFASQVEGFLTSATSTLNSKYPDLGGQFTTAVGNLLEALVSPSTYQSSSMSALFQPLAVIATDAAEFASVIIQDLLTLIGKVAGDLLSMLNQPLNIPLISDLYLWITGETLTVINLFSLLVAIPVTLVYKAVYDKAPIDSSASILDGGVAYSPEVAQVVYTFGMIVYGIFDGLSDYWPLPYANPFAWPCIALSGAVLTSLVLTFDPPLFTTEAGLHNDLYVIGSFFMLVLAVYGTSETADTKTVNMVTGVSGVSLLIFSIFLAATCPDTWFDPEGASLEGNIIGCISPIMKPTSIPGSDKAFIDGASDIVCGIFNVANFGSANGNT